MKIESEWTRRKNKEQYGNKTTSYKQSPLKPLYIGNNIKSKNARQEELRKEKFVWRVGFVIIAVVLVLGVWMIWTMATL